MCDRFYRGKTFVPASSNPTSVSCPEKDHPEWSKLLEVDLDYPDELHDFYNDYSLAGEKIEVTQEILSEYQLQIMEYNFFLARNKKLTPHLGNERKYKPHY